MVARNEEATIEMTRIVAIEDVIPGMVLAESIFTPDGGLLIIAGVVLTQRHQRLIRRRRIATIVVHHRGVPAIVIPTDTDEYGSVETLEREQHDTFMQQLLQAARDRHRH